MSSAVAELDAVLQSMLNLKPPGVSGSKISSLTALCTANVQSESLLIQKIYTHFKKTPGTHKLGVLYVVDSVTRQWVDQARKNGQTVSSAAPDGTFAAGVNRVTELLPVLMNDIIVSAPEDQKARIKKLIDIWERSSTFSPAMLAPFKKALDDPTARNDRSTTPLGSPPPDATAFGQLTNSTLATPAQQDTTAILEALKNMAKQTAPVAPTSSVPGQASMNALPGAQVGAQSTVNQGPSPVPGQAVNPLGNIFAGLSNGTQSQNPANVSQNPFAFLSQPQAPQAPLAQQSTAPGGQDAQAQIQILQLLAAQGVPPDQWPTVLQILNMQNGAGANGAAPILPQMQWSGQAVGASRDQYTRSPPNQHRDRDGRGRSRSPDRRGYREGSPRRRRDSPSYEQNRGQDNRRGNDYRQRSPGRRRRSPTPPRSDPKLPPPGPKNVEFDHGLPRGHIKVLSRTLFVGGVTSSESHLRSLFANYGIVQTCIVNIDKRHAFVKMICRKDAVNARNGMEEYKSGDVQLRTKWGVGFGPRDCSDYQTGISIIPIDRLTEADRKWMLTAEYGGTGGRPIEQGMVVEEPDIEIGAGVSSKAMSRRIATDQGGKRGPQSSRAANHGLERKDDRTETSTNRPGSSSNNAGPSGSVASTMPGLAMNFPGFPNGMPMFPPGFTFPFPAQQNTKPE